MRTCSVCRRFNPSAGPHCPRDGGRTNDGPPPEFAAGTKVFGRFEIGEPVARGDTGTLYRARDEAGAAIVLKIVHTALTQNAVDRSRIKRELNKASSVSTPRIAPIREVGETEARIFLIREFLEGDAVASLLHRDGPFELARAARITHAVASALVEAHKVGVLHRDLNPRHVIVLPDGLPSLIDVALAAPIPGGIAGKPATGSLRSLSPEQAAGKLVTLRTDLYGLGLLLFEMLTGVGPSPSSDPTTAVAERAVAEPPPPPPGVPDEIAVLLGQLLARDPKDRPFGARQVEKVLSKFALEAAPRPTTAPLRSALPLARAADVTAAFGTGPATARVVPVTMPPGLAPIPGPSAPTVTGSPSLEEELGQALVQATRGRRDATAAIASGLEEPVPPVEPVPVVRADKARRASTQTLIGVPLPASADGSPQDRQTWARNLLGMPEDGTPPPPRPVTVPMGALQTLVKAADVATAQTAVALAASPASIGQEDTDRQPIVMTPLDAPVVEVQRSSPESVSTPPLPMAPPLSGARSTSRAPARPPVDDTQEISFRDLEPETGAGRPSLADLEAAARALVRPAVGPSGTDQGIPVAPAATLDASLPVSPARAWALPEEDDASSVVAPMRASSKRLALIAGVSVVGVLGLIGVAVALMGGSSHPVVPPASTAAPSVHATGGTVRSAGAPAAPSPTPRPVPAPGTPSAPVAVVAPVATADAGTAAVVPADPAATTLPAPAPPVPAPAAGPADTDPRQTDEIIKAGRGAIRRRRWADAKNQFTIAIGRDPQSLDATLGLAQVAMEQHAFDDAVRQFHRAVELRPTSATFQDYLGNALNAAGDHAGATQAWQRALELDPRNAEARQRLGLSRRARPRPTHTTRNKQAPRSRRGPMIRRNPY